MHTNVGQIYDNVNLSCPQRVISARRIPAGGQDPCPDILVIEDDAALAIMLLEILEDEGYRVKLAYSGESALTTLLTWYPQLIVCDVYLPDISVVAICHAVQNNPATAHIPIIVCSASDETLIRDQCTYAAFLPKPFDIDALLALIAHYCRPSLFLADHYQQETG